MTRLTPEREAEIRRDADTEDAKGLSRTYRLWAESARDLLAEIDALRELNTKLSTDLGSAEWVNQQLEQDKSRLRQQLESGNSDGAWL